MGRIFLGNPGNHFIIGDPYFTSHVITEITILLATVILSIFIIITRKGVIRRKMTIAGWLLFFIIAGLIIGISVGAAWDAGYSIKIPLIISCLVSVLILIGMLWWFGNTAKGQRALKTQKSNFEKGIERTVKVYDVEGELIQEYSGKFDVAYDDDRIIFDDEKGKRHIIYYPTGTVIIDENGDEA